MSKDYGRNVLKELGRVFGYGEAPYLNKKELAALGAAVLATAGIIIGNASNDLSKMTRPLLPVQRQTFPR